MRRGAHERRERRRRLFGGRRRRRAAFAPAFADVFALAPSPSSPARPGASAVALVLAPCSSRAIQASSVVTREARRLRARGASSAGSSAGGRRARRCARGRLRPRARRRRCRRRRIPASGPTAREDSTAAISRRAGRRRAGPRRPGGGRRRCPCRPGSRPAAVARSRAEPLGAARRDEGREEGHVVARRRWRATRRVAATTKALRFNCVGSICQRSSTEEWMYSSGQFVSEVPGTRDPGIVEDEVVGRVEVGDRLRAEGLARPEPREDRLREGLRRAAVDCGLPRGEVGVVARPRRRRGRSAGRRRGTTAATRACAP